MVIAFFDLIVIDLFCFTSYPEARAVTLYSQLGQSSYNRAEAKLFLPSLQAAAVSPGSACLYVSYEDRIALIVDLSLSTQLNLFAFNQIK